MNAKQDKITYLIVEDNLIDEWQLSTLANEYPVLQHIATAGNALEAATLIRSTLPELVFMDIDMPGGSGIELLRTLKQHIPITVFTTAHPEYALEGFELSALDYLLKPLTEERFAQTMQRVTEYRQLRQKASLYDVLFEKEMLVFKEGFDQVRLPQQEVIYLEAMQDYTKVVTRHKKYMVNMPLSGFMSQVAQAWFIRIHRSYAVSVSHIQVLQTNAVICDQVTLPIGKTYRTAVAQLKRQS